MKTEVQKSEFMFPKSHSYQLAGLGFQPRTLAFRLKHILYRFFLGFLLKPHALKRQVGILTFIKVKHLRGKYAVEEDVNPLPTLSYTPLRSAKYLAS